MMHPSEKPCDAACICRSSPDMEAILCFYPCQRRVLAESDPSCTRICTIPLLSSRPMFVTDCVIIRSEPLSQKKEESYDVSEIIHSRSRLLCCDFLKVQGFLSSSSTTCTDCWNVCYCSACFVLGLKGSPAWSSSIHHN